MYNQIYQVVVRIIEVSIIIFVMFRFIRWHLFYHEVRKNRCTSYNFIGKKIKRKFYVKREGWLRQRNHFFGIEQPIEVRDYSEGNRYYVESKQK